MIRREAVGGVVAGVLQFAQMCEDQALEQEALRPDPGMVTVMVSSGGCTALSYLSRFDGTVVSVDRNPVQNHVTELKVAAANLDPQDAPGALGAWARSPDQRLELYRSIRHELSAAARAHWDRSSRAVRSGVLGAGITERFIAAVVKGVKLAIHPERRIREMLSQPTLESQRAYYDAHWNNRRWKAIFPILLHRAMFPAFRRTYDPSFFEHVGNYSFAEHLYKKFEHVLTSLPVASNYLLHFTLLGTYPRNGLPDSLPPYLTEHGLSALRERRDQLTLVDGGLTEYLRTRPARSVHRFALSNVAEWMRDEEILALFGEVVRTAAPGALVCLRNLVGWTEIPPSLREVLVEETSARSLMARERSIMQRRFSLFRVVS